MCAVPQSLASQLHHANRSHGPVVGARVHDDADDDCVEADSGGEDDNDEHGDEGSAILRSNKSSA